MTPIVRATAAALLIVSFPYFAAAAGPAIGTYTLVSSKRVSQTDWEVSYRASLTNTGEALRSVIATVTSSDPATQVIEGALSFGDVAAGATVVSEDTFTIRQNRSKPFDAAVLVWSISSTPDTPLRAVFIANPSTGPAPLDVTFSPDPLTDAAVTRYEWDFNGDARIDVTDTVGRNQKYRYAAPGTYSASLKVTDSQGRTDTRTLPIIVSNAPPVVSASANPTNGQVPLLVNFFVTASDNEGVAKYEWDFDGDGTFDSILTGSGNIARNYDVAGTFSPRLRVTDSLGAMTTIAVPAMTIRAAPPGSPSVSMNVSPATGLTPLTANFSATASDPQGKPITSYEWDFDGDGTFDRTSTTTSQSYVYNTAGIFYPQVRITTQDGRSAIDVKTVVVNSAINLSVSTDTVDTNSGQSTNVNTTLGGSRTLSIVIEKRGGGVVRTLLPKTTRVVGSYTDTWDGKSDGGTPVAEGIYYAVVLYDENGVTKRLDLSTTTGGAEFNPSRTAIPSSFSPFDGQPLKIDFTLTRAAEVTAFMGSFNVNTRYITFYTRQPFGKGTYRIEWNGDSSEGQLIQLAPGDSFLFGIFGYTLPNNGIFVRNGVMLTALRASPSIFNPTGLDQTGQANLSTIEFQLSQPATVEVVVQDTDSGTVIRRFQAPNLKAGPAVAFWDGKASDGRYAAPGEYRIGVTAIQANGFKSLSSYTLQRVYY